MPVITNSVLVITGVCSKLQTIYEEEGFEY